MMHHKTVESGNIPAETNILQGIWSKGISSCMFLDTVACGCFFRENRHKWPMLFFNRFYWHNQEPVGRPNSTRFRRFQDCPISHLPTFFRAPIRSNSQQLSHQLAALEASSFSWGYCEWVITCLWMFGQKHRGCFSKDDGDGGIRPNHDHVCIYVSHFNF